ncbi:MAG: hypothetical protein OIF32_09645, partial [Campylobacterales bacterium]|nr:hypothetical protein [Campylobacterales bacterium]
APDNGSSNNTTGKSYYGIKMYEHPDDSFSHVITSGLYSVYATNDDYWDSVSVVDTESHGIVKVVLKKRFYSDEYGTSAKSAYSDFNPSLEEKYDHNQSFDFCSGSSYVCQSSNFAYAIYRGERYYADYYNNGNDIIAISLRKTSSSIYDIDLEIGYETQEFRDLDSEETSNIADNL